MTSGNYLTRILLALALIIALLCSSAAAEDLSGEALREAISASIKAKKDDLVGNMASQGTTPRQLTDLIGSLCDLTSGSGDKGTPVVYIQGYFDNYTTD